MDNAESMKMSHKLLKEITHDFSKELGCGTYGVVYKGTDANGREVAVKVLRDMAALDVKKFTNEFQTLAKLDHENIVQLVGYCNESEPVVVDYGGRQVAAEKLHVALCFEYVNNGSLGNHISDEKQGLEWHIRYKIIKGICAGLNYLHEGLQEPVLHLDLKPDNILLDKEMVPKIADFGLSRLIGDERTKQTMNKFIGTHGYVPPEYMKSQLLSRAFDIFSLGVIITKIMMGRERYHDIADMPSGRLVQLVHTSWKNRLQETEGLRSRLEVYCQQVKTCIKVASKCLMEGRQQRPTIQQIVATLNKTDMIHSIPSRQIEKFHDGQSTHATRRSIVSVLTSVYCWMHVWGCGLHKRGQHQAKRTGPATCSMAKESTVFFQPRSLPFILLKGITNDFSADRIIGKGIIGDVYKGIYEDGTIIAVKILHKHVRELVQGFERVAASLCHVQHENIVQLVGYCEETEDIVVEHNGRNIVVEMSIRALCFEYVQNGSLERYISDECSGLDWRTRYKIIKGICVGLRHLHEGLPSPIFHMDLTPQHILLDENMTPKIGQFGISTLLEAHSTLRPDTSSLWRYYMAPEYINKGVISNKHDIFSLGVIMLEMITTHPRRRIFQSEEQKKAIELVVGMWRKRLQQETSKARSVEGYCHQVMACILIALKCVEDDRHDRPDIGEVIRALDETETWIHDDSDLLDVHPTDLRFAFKPKKHASCLVQLHNKQDDLVAFRIMCHKSPKRYHTSLPLHGMVPPRCTYTLALMTSKQLKPPPSDSDEALVLWSVAVSHSQELQLKNLSDQASASREYENMFRKAQESADDEMQEVTLKCISAPPPADEEATSSDQLSAQKIEIIATLNAHKVSSVQVHPTEPWILTTHEGGNLRHWNYKTTEVLNSFEDEAFYIAKFIPQEEWIVAGDGNGWIHVFSCDGYQDPTSFEAHDGHIMSLAVHPTDSYVLSSSHDDHLIKLWHWDMHWDFKKAPWACTRTFEGHTDRVSQLVFNREDPGCFASASWDGTVKIWSLNSDVCKTIMSDTHQDGLLCVDFITGADHQHLITGSKDQTAQIWDLEIHRRREYLQGHTDHVSVVYYQPDHQKLITGSLDGTIRIWDATTYRLENIIALNLGAVSDVGYIEELQRIIVGCYQGIAMMEINFHELSIASKGRKQIMP
ncbi:receptor like protein kinase S.2-like isoform X3 [Miscanthus floridulus]|uniref:receptor like protein kinase S.2-like isoform X3 n=1 Tax=Miscanthus floridulus TaxID=154761 RepID=UPI00345A8E2A